MPAGRPSKLTPEHVEIAGRLAGVGMPISKIAACIGFSDRTLTRWISETRDEHDDSLRAQFCRAIHEAWLRAGEGYLRNLREQSANGTTAAATWFLTHHPFFRDDFSDAAADRRVEKRTVASVIDAIAAAGLPPDQERAVLLQIQARGLAGDQPAGGGDADTLP